MLTLVVARYREDISWVTHVDANVFVVDKSQIGNTGREASSWLWFMAQHYDSLKGHYLFCQGDPSAHCADFIRQVAIAHHACGAVEQPQRHFGVRFKCDWDGAPDHPGLKIREAVKVIEGRWGRALVLPEEIEFTAGAQFMVSAAQIRFALRNHGAAALIDAVTTLPQGPWIFERLWDYLIP